MESVATSIKGGSESKVSSDKMNCCGWCQKPGLKLFTLRTCDGSKTFCSEMCFSQCRRASFKKNKICHWCKHIRHTVTYLDFFDGSEHMQFCSNKCLQQFKMNIMQKELMAQSSPQKGGSIASTNMKTTSSTPVDLSGKQNKKRSIDPADHKEKVSVEIKKKKKETNNQNSSSKEYPVSLGSSTMHGASSDPLISHILKQIYSCHQMLSKNMPSPPIDPRLPFLPHLLMGHPRFSFPPSLLPSPFKHTVSPLSCSGNLIGQPGILASPLSSSSPTSASSQSSAEVLYHKYLAALSGMHKDASSGHSIHPQDEPPTSSSSSPSKVRMPNRMGSTTIGGGSGTGDGAPHPTHHTLKFPPTLDPSFGSRTHPFAAHSIRNLVPSSTSFPLFPTVTPSVASAGSAASSSASAREHTTSGLRRKTSSTSSVGSVRSTPSPSPPTTSSSSSKRGPMMMHLSSCSTSPLSSSTSSSSIRG